VLESEDVASNVTAYSTFRAVKIIMGQSDAILSVPFFLPFPFTRQVHVTFFAAVRRHVSARHPLDGFS
jgi:hypothetical protein